MNRDELKYWVAFGRIPRIGRVRFALLEKHFGSLGRAWGAGAQELRDGGVDSATAELIAARRPAIDPDAEVAHLDASGVQAFTWHDDEYPARLKQIYDLPPVIYVKGRLLPEDERSVAVVGTRRPTAYGREAAHRLSYDLAVAGVTIVSGLARGIDAIGHRAALEANKRTLAVLGNGLDIVYPAEHAGLAGQIVRNGALISEHPLGVRPAAINFPRRNRILSGMTLGTLVVEAGDESGALITASHALEQDREVFVVPGSIFSPASSGTNRLISDSGGKLVTDARDILEELNLTYVGQQLELKALFPEDENEREVLRHVTFDPIHIDEVIRSTGLPISTVSGLLAMMELKNMIRQVGGMNYVRIKEGSAGYKVTA